MANPSATAFSPASVGNIGVGFDILGHSIDGIGDRATVQRIDSPEVRINRIEGCITNLPLEAKRNTAGQALLRLREQLQLPFGFEIALYKGIPLGSGLGGSAASCVAALIAANALLDTPLSREALYPFALDGEAIASGSRHGDNVAPMLFGGVVLATELQAVTLAAPDWLHAVVVHPDQVLETRRSREVLSAPYPIKAFVAQSQCLALFLTGLARGDAELIRAGLRDLLVEPRRAVLIPGFATVKQAAMDCGALGASISGGGPSVFAWFASRELAEQAAKPMRQGFAQHDIRAQAFVSAVNGPRAELIA